MRLAQGLGEAASRLADSLQIAQYGILNKGKVDKGLATTCNVLRDTSKTFANVDDIQSILDRVDTAFYLS
jgi:hypothetical protein